MVHLAPLPGAPRATPRSSAAAAVDAALRRAVSDARVWRRSGADALLVENFGDRPFLPESVEPVTVAAMACALAAVRDAVDLPLGVNVLRNDARAALSLAAVFDLDFVRVNVHAGVAASDQGLLVGRAHETLRLRAALRCEAAILADLRVKHAHPLVESSLADEAHDLFDRAGADALLLTGPQTGRKPDLAELAEVRRALPRAPLLLASGVDPRLVATTRDSVAGWIVGTWAKVGGRVEAPPDPRRVAALARARDGR
jgi:membrane complex biogenesis BtpA family protein